MEEEGGREDECSLYFQRGEIRCDMRVRKGRSAAAGLCLRHKRAISGVEKEGGREVEGVGIRERVWEKWK